MSTMEAALAAKANGEVLVGDALKDFIARTPPDADRGPGKVSTEPTRQRQVGLG